MENSVRTQWQRYSEQKLYLVTKEILQGWGESIPMNITNTNELNSSVWGQGTDRQNPVSGQRMHR